MPLSPGNTISEAEYTRQSYEIGRGTRNSQNLTISYNEGDRWNPNQLTIEWTGTQKPSTETASGLASRTLENLGLGNASQYTIEQGHSDGQSFIRINDSRTTPFPATITSAENRVVALDALAQQVGQHVPNEAISRAFRDANIRLSGVYSHTDLTGAMEIPRHDASDPRVIIGTNADGQTVVRVDIAGASRDNLPNKMLAAEKIIGHLQAQHGGGSTNITDVADRVARFSDSQTTAYDVVNRAGNPSITLLDGVKPGDVLQSLSRPGSVRIGDMTHHYQPVITPEGAAHASGQLNAYLFAESPAVRARTVTPDAPRGGGAAMAVVSGVVVAGSVLYTGGNTAEAAQAGLESAASAIPFAGGAIAASNGEYNEARVRNTVDALTGIATIAGAWVGGVLGGAGGPAAPATVPGGAVVGGAVANIGSGLLADEMLRFGARYIDGQEDVAPAPGEKLVVAVHTAAVEKTTRAIEAAFAEAKDIGDALSKHCSYDGCAVDIAVQSPGTTRSPYSITK